MRVLHLVNRVAESGNGISNLVVDLAAGQAAIGLETHLATLGGDYEVLLEERGVTLHRIDFTRRKPLAMWRAMRALHALRRELRPDVIHAHTIAAAVLARLVCGRSKVVATVHNEWQRGAVLMAFAHRVVGVSESVRESMRRQGIRPSKLSVVRNGVVGSFRRRPVAAAQLQHPAIVTVGSISERKGSDVLLSAFQMVRTQVPEAHLYFVGNGDSQQIVDLIRSPDLGRNVHMQGFDPAPQRYLLSADIFVLASRKEPFGLALVEAMEQGVACVGADTEGIREILSDGSGILVPIGQADALAAAIVSVLSNADLAVSLGRSARRRSADYGVMGMAQEYLRIYHVSSRAK